MTRFAQRAEPLPHDAVRSPAPLPPLHALPAAAPVAAPHLIKRLALPGLVLLLAVLMVLIATLVNRPATPEALPTETFMSTSRPLPAFVRNYLGQPIAGNAQDEGTTYPTKLGQVFSAGADDDRANHNGFAMLNPEPVMSRQSYETGVRFTTAEYDVVQDRGSALIRENTIVHVRQGVRTWSWRAVGEGALTMLEDGSIRYGNGGRVEAPVVFDAAGRKIDIPGLHWRLDGRTFSLTLDDVALPLPYVIDPDSTNPVIKIDRITSTSDCVYVNGTNVWVRTRTCAGDFNVRTVAFDEWQSTNPADSPVGMHATNGVNFPAAPAAVNGTVNFPNAALALPGHGKGLEVTCWNTDQFSGVTGTGIDTKLDYDAGRYGTTRGFRGVHTWAAGHPPRTTIGGTGDMSCYWKGYIAPRGNNTGNYNFKIYSDDQMRLDIGASGANHTGEVNCGGPTPLICNWTNHAPTWNGPAPVNVADRWDARPITATWGERGGDGATAVIWAPPSGPAVSPTITANGGNPAQGGYEVVPESVYWQDIYYDRTYAWTADMSDPLNGNYGMGVVARDAGSLASTATFNLRLDSDLPEPINTFSVTVAPNWTTNDTWTNDNTVVIAKRDAIDSGVGIDTTDPTAWRLERRFAPFVPGTATCGAAQPLQVITPVGNPAATPNTWTFNTGTPVQTLTDTVGDGCYYYQYVREDRVGNAAISKMALLADINDPSTWMKVDTTNPIFPPDSFAFVEAIGSEDYLFDSFQPGAPVTTRPTMWYNPNASGSFTVATAVDDAGRGVDRVEFDDPDLGTSGWPTAGGMVVDDADRKVTPYEATFSWSLGATSPGIKEIRAYDLVNPPGANGPSSFFYDVIADGAAPTGGSLATKRGPYAGCPTTLATQQYFTSSICVELSGVPIDNAPGDSGVDLGRGVFERREAPLSNGNCGVFSLWTSLSPLGPPAVYEDTSTLNGNCYEYRYRVPDRVGNFRTVSNGVVARKDITAPVGAIDAIAENPGSGPVLITGTSLDAHSGVDYVRVQYDGPDADSLPDGNWCPSAPPGPPLTAGNWSCTVDTSAFTDGAYTIMLTVFDRAGNQSTTYTRPLVLDNLPPVVTSIQFTELTNAGFQYANNCALPCTPQIFFNPAESGSFSIDVVATDSGSGVGSVQYPDIDGVATEWSPDGGGDGTDPYSLPFQWTGPGATALSFLDIVTFDIAGSYRADPISVTPDAVAPSGGSIVNPPSAVNTLSVPISYVSGNDGVGSGIESVVVERRAATLSGGNCGGFGGWTPVTLVGGNDTSVLTGQCYQ
ncbi:MAG: laminin sub domain 2, partial [Thermoleophilia bacterium]|nr:laminin sub domain 2 [Thermoleophilia bacterium]